MLLEQPISDLLAQLRWLTEELSDGQYTQTIPVLGGATLGQHVRHILEFFLELDTGYKLGTVNYDQRKRDYLIESDRFIARAQIERIMEGLCKPDRDLLLVNEMGIGDPVEIKISTNYCRELIHNFEHTVHHMALMRIGIVLLTDILLPEEFGVAASTIKFRKACAQ
jgi:hypothetical protein